MLRASTEGECAEIDVARWSAFARSAGFGETDFAWKETRGQVGALRRPGRSSAKPSEVWLGVRDDFRNWLIVAA